VKKHITSLASRVLFILSIIIACIPIWEKLANIIGFTVVQGYYTSWQIWEIAVIILLYVIALQLREIKLSIASKKESL